MLYKLVNKNTNEVQEVIWTVAKKEQFLKDNPDWYNCLDKVPTFKLVGDGWYANARNEKLRGQDALDNAMRERDALEHDFNHHKGKYKRANYLHDKAEDKAHKMMDN